ncbi:MAG TPA: response regulator [Vicinamibacteria bacterium]|nr:response regulator [Vicinamibacteria bacterium]
MSGKKKILMADDSRTALLMTSMALKTLPYEVQTALDGEEAVQKALADPPDLIVLDVVMPKLDGFETCRRLRENDATRAVPIIMLTTRGEGENRDNGFHAGCTEYLTKPLNMPEFLAKVRTHLAE